MVKSFGHIFQLWSWNTALCCFHAGPTLNVPKVETHRICCIQLPTTLNQFIFPIFIFLYCPLVFVVLLFHFSSHQLSTKIFKTAVTGNNFKTVWGPSNGLKVLAVGLVFMAWMGWADGWKPRGYVNCLCRPAVSVLLGGGGSPLKGKEPFFFCFHSLVIPPSLSLQARTTKCLSWWVNSPDSKTAISFPWRAVPL